MPNDPLKVIAHFKDLTLTLTPKSKSPKEEKEHGLSMKGHYIDETSGADFYMKSPKQREPRKFFGKEEDPAFHALIEERAKLVGRDVKFDPLTEELLPQEKLPKEIHVQYDNIQNQIRKKVEHVREVVIKNTVGGLIASRLAEETLGDLIKIPHNYIYLAEDNIPRTLSKSDPHFDEFVTDNLYAFLQDSKPETPTFWETHKRPMFKDLVKTPEQAKILGQLYGIALLIGHYDILNNIDCSNAGMSVANNGAHVAMYVDEGNIGLGQETYSGKGDDLTIQNSYLTGVSSPPKDFFDPSRANIGGFDIVPFDTVVFPVIPRQIAPDLFDLSSQDDLVLRAAMCEGFYAVCDKAWQTLHEKEFAMRVCKNIQDTVEYYIDDDSKSRVKNCLNQAYYHFTQDEDKSGSAYDCAAILAGRIQSLHKMKVQLQEGVSLNIIAHERLAIIRSSQRVPQFMRFFKSPKKPYEKHQQAQLMAKITSAI